MSTVLVSCKTLEQEVLLTMQKKNCQYPVYWLESGLHNIPEQLNDRIQTIFDNMAGQVDRVILAMSFCGNAINGLKTRNFELIVPRADDCITLLLGSYDRRLRVMQEGGTYFLTEGWLKGERNIWAEYEHAVKKYGELRAKRIYAIMLSHYEWLAYLKTEACRSEEVRIRTEQIADSLGLKHRIIEGTLDFLGLLLTGPWDDSSLFLRVDPNSSITTYQLWLSTDT